MRGTLWWNACLVLTDRMRQRTQLTIDPSYTNTLQNGKNNQWDPTAGLVVKQLKHIKSSLQSMSQKGREKVPNRQREENVLLDNSNIICSVVSMQEAILCMHFQLVQRKPQSREREHTDVINKTTLTSVTIKRPLTKDTLQMTSRRSLRRWPAKKKDGYMSDMHVTRPSRHTNCGSKKTEQNGMVQVQNGLKLPTDTDSNEPCIGN